MNLDFLVSKTSRYTLNKFFMFCISYSLLVLSLKIIYYSFWNYHVSIQNSNTSIAYTNKNI